MIKKVILIIYKDMESFEYEKYGGSIFEKYFDVEVWSLANIFFKQEVKVKDLFPMQKRIKSVKELIICLKKYRNKAIHIIFFLPSGVRIAYYLQALVSLMGFSFSMTYPQLYLAKWNTGSLKENFIKRKTDYFNALLNAFFPPMFNFLATATCYNEFTSKWSIRHQKNILIHTLDYDVYLKIYKENERVIQDRYILFIDENLVNHSIYQVMNVKPPVKRPEDYYVPVRHFFNYIERLYGYQVVIAEHPRAHYSDREIYGNRMMIHGQTAKLIRDAELVLCHKSIALDYIILFKKKFLVFYLDVFKQFYQWEDYYIPFFHYLNCQGLNISQPYNDDMIKRRVASGRSKECEKYQQHYIKVKGTQEKLFFEIVSQYILSIAGDEE